MADKQALADRYLAALNGELGWNARVEDDGQVSFARGEVRFWISNYADSDPEYLQMHIGFKLGASDEENPGFDLADPVSFAALQHLAAVITRETKGVKVLIDREHEAVEFSVEIVAAGTRRMPTLEHLVNVLPRMLTMVEAGMHAFARAACDYVELAGIEAASA